MASSFLGLSWWSSATDVALGALGGLVFAIMNRRRRKDEEQ
jgi:hypothetical protein